MRRLLTTRGHRLGAFLSRLCPCLADLVVPPACSLCNQVLSGGNRTIGLCPRCLGRVFPVRSPICTICGAPFETDTGPDHVCSRCLRDPPAFQSARSLFLYDGTVAELLKRLKFARRLHTLRPLAKLAAERLTKDDITALLGPKEGDPPPRVVIPIPMTFSKEMTRGFNQAALLAEAIFSQGPHGMPVSHDLLVKVRNTRSQASLPLSDRKKNVKGCFSAHPSRLKGMEVILFDDVHTTGSTLKEAASVLQRSGVSKIFALTLARTPQHGNFL